MRTCISLLVAAALLVGAGLARSAEKAPEAEPAAAGGDSRKAPPDEKSGVAKSGNGKPKPESKKRPYEFAIVTVNKRAVTRSYLRILMSRGLQRLERLRKARKDAGRWAAEDDEAYDRALYNLRLAAIREVVFGEILRGEAERFLKMGLKVPEREIEKYWRKQLKEAGSAGELARKQGLSVAALKELSRDQILAEAYRANLRSTIAKPTPQEIADYYKFNSERLRRAESVRARAIFIKRFVFDAALGQSVERKNAARRAESIIAKINKGLDFEKAARRYSEDPDTARNGGLLGERKQNFLITQGKLERNLDQAVFGGKPGRVSAVIKGPENLYIVKVEKHLAAGVPPLEEIEKDVFRRCYSERIRKAEERLFKRSYNKVLVRDANGRRIPLEALLPGKTPEGRSRPGTTREGA